jgi:hypothetical protein
MFIYFRNHVVNNGYQDLQQVFGNARRGDFIW